MKMNYSWTMKESYYRHSKTIYCKISVFFLWDRSFAKFATTCIYSCIDSLFYVSFIGIIMKLKYNKGVLDAFICLNKEKVFVDWGIKTKGRISDPVLWQKPLCQQKCQRDKVTTQTTPQKSSIKQQLRTDLGRSVGVTSATQLVWLTGLRAHLPTPRNSRVIKRTHI